MAFFRNLAVATAAALMLGGSAMAAEKMVRSGTITIDETQFGFILGGSSGGGTLVFKGKPHKFKIGGLSVGNVGVSKVRGSGEVYNLARLEDFAGTYSKLEASATLVEGAGSLRLQNDNGVILKIDTKSGGLQLSAGAGGVKVSLKK